MKIALNTLKYQVDIPVSLEELCEKMVLAGFEVESVDNLADTMDNVVVGRILKLEKHENSDHLQICQVDIGSEVVQIVTGAQNVFEGAIVPAGKGEAQIKEIISAHREYAEDDFFVSLEPHLQAFSGLNALVGRSFKNPYQYEDQKAAFSDAVNKFKELI